MYVERKAGALTGEAWIGRAALSRTGRTIYFHGLHLQRLSTGGYKANHYDIASGEEYWVSGPKRKGGDRLYGERVPVHVDEDVREEYWSDVRGQPDRATHKDASH